MTNPTHCDLGLIGLGVMGRNFLLNLADNGFAVAGYDLDEAKVSGLRDESDDEHIVTATADLDEFLAALARPRAVMLLVPAGEPVDAVIRDLRPRLHGDDVIVDGGNSHFTDTARRQSELGEAGIHLLGTGVSGGAAGARHGPSIMPGGPQTAWKRVAALFTRAAAQVDGEPCVAYLGTGAAGHHVKMVHNGIEYGVMQLIAETYDLLRHGRGLAASEIAEIFARWREGPAAGFLVEITADILAREDPDTGQPLVDLIRDAARQKGTGRWTSQEALELQVPTPTIDAAVTARNLSGLREQREAASALLDGPATRGIAAAEHVVDQLGEALFAAMVLSYVQGFALLHRASRVHGFGLDLPTVARIWRGGCIIRAAVLEDLRTALADDAERPNLLLHPDVAALVGARMGGLRKVVAVAAVAGLPVPSLTASLAYYDGLRSERLPANLIQAQRDYFGSHGYRRVDREGDFHTDWCG